MDSDEEFEEEESQKKRKKKWVKDLSIAVETGQIAFFS